jgi:REP element-mobilizing transposase RayT
MPAAPRILLPNSVVFVTSRTEAGLPLVPGPLMKSLLKSIIARAQALYPVKLCHFLFMGNHFHMLLVVKDPVDTMHFIERIKTESAHMVNRLLGIRRKTVWCAGYDAEPILTADDVIEKIAYLYTNPQKVGLVDSIDEYPGLSSWGSPQVEEVPRIPRTAIGQLPALSLTEKQQQRFVDSITPEHAPTHLLQLTPNAWLTPFRLEGAHEQMTERMLSRVREIEQDLASRRADQRQSTIGPYRLIIQPFNLPFTPKKFAKRMWCICRDRDKRKTFIEFIKNLRDKARRVYERWCQGERGVEYPPGMFPPRFPQLANLIVAPT